jgi:hypothetical protein
MQNTYQPDDRVYVHNTDSCLDSRCASVIKEEEAGSYFLSLDTPCGVPGFGIVSGVSLPVRCLKRLSL